MNPVPVEPHLYHTIHVARIFPLSPVVATYHAGSVLLAYIQSVQSPVAQAM